MTAACRCGGGGIKRSPCACAAGRRHSSHQGDAEDTAARTWQRRSESGTRRTVLVTGTPVSQQVSRNEDGKRHDMRSVLGPTLCRARREQQRQSGTMHATASAWAAVNTRTRIGCRASAGAGWPLARLWTGLHQICSTDHAYGIEDDALEMLSQWSLQVASEDGGAHGLLLDPGLCEGGAHVLRLERVLV